MKRIRIILLLTAIMMQGFNHELSAKDQNGKKQGTVVKTDRNTKVSVGKDFLSIEESDSALKVRIGNRGLSILESLEGPKLNYDRYNENDEWNLENTESDRSHRARKFKGHWSGIDFGFNNYTHITNMVLPDEISYMDLNSGKSHSFNINFSQLSLGITRHFGLVTGLGLNWNNYRFAGNNNIKIDDNGNIGVLVPDNGEILKKSKFTTLYLTMPAMLELQLPAGEGHRLNIAAGVIGGMKLNSHTKMVFENGQKLKSNNDLNLNLLRGGLTARIGYGNFMIYGSYYLTPWFEEMNGPYGYELEPFEIGVAFTFND